MLLKYKIVIGVLGVLCVLGLAGVSQYRGSHASVGLHGINYSDREFSYFIADPDDPNHSLGGEHIAPFAGGGTTCCALLPWKWKPGTKIRLTTIHWLKKRPDGSLPEVTKEHEVEVPEYIEAGELWVIRDANGKISVVSSNVQPDHPSWTGRIKGWPVPSLDYQRERWELFRKLEEHSVSVHQSLLNDLEEEPGKEAKEAWEYAKEHRPSELAGFTGPDDPRYIQYLKKDYTDGLNRTKAQLEEIIKAKP